MFRNMFYLIFGIFLIVSCSKENTDVKKEGQQSKVYTLEELMSDDFEYKDGKVTVEGLCIHVCAHTGKKMFLAGKDPDFKLLISTSNELGTFDKKFEGSNVRVTGTLEEEKMDAAYIAEMEAQIAKDAAENKESCDTEKEMKNVDVLKARLAKSKKGYISKYYMTGFEVKSI